MSNFTVINEAIHRFPVVVNLPHSGTFVPPDIKRNLLATACLSNTDWFLPELYDFLPEMGCTTLINHLSRYVVDVNRSASANGTGDYRKTVVYKENTQGKPLYRSPPGEDEINRRIALYYMPYHEALEKLIKEKLKKHSTVLLLDLHSFFIDFVKGGNQDVYLSNKGGQTSCVETLNHIHSSFCRQALTVLDNAIMGGHAISHYRTLFGECLEGVLIELRYTKYIEERYFGEEEVTRRDEKLFHSAKQKLRAAFMQLPCFK